MTCGNAVCSRPMTWDIYRKYRDHIRERRFRRYARWPGGGYMGVRIWDLSEFQNGGLAPLACVYPRTMLWGSETGLIDDVDGYHAFWPPAAVYHTEDKHPQWLMAWLIRRIHGFAPKSDHVTMDYCWRIGDYCWGIVEAPIGATIVLHQRGWRASIAYPKLVYLRPDLWPKSERMAREIERAHGCQVTKIWPGCHGNVAWRAIARSPAV